MVRKWLLTAAAIAAGCGDSVPQKKYVPPAGSFSESTNIPSGVPGVSTVHTVEAATVENPKKEWKDGQGIIQGDRPKNWPQK